MQEVDNILRILKETEKSIKDNDFYKLKQLSNQTIHSAAISQDPDNIVVAVLIYALGKILERTHYREQEGWNEFYTPFVQNLERAITSLEKGDVKRAREAFGKIRNSINKMEGNLKSSIQDVLKKAELNKAFKIYEHGLSSEQTADLLGVSLWDLASYIGQSSISESKINEGINVKKRVQIAEDIFG
jgi:methyl-accepting chemotaxis protein